MASKKEEKVEEKPLLGRVSHHLKMGIVGLPNVGKSTTFNLLTKLEVPAENYPFCTKDPNKARVTMPDERFDFLCNAFKPLSKVPAYLEVVDIAGLVKGASQGLGMGNAFLSNIRAVDGIFHVVRVFEDEAVMHVENSVDPVRDLEIISDELLQKDIEIMNSHIEPIRRVAKADKTKRGELDIAEKIFNWLSVDKKEIRLGNWNAKEIEYLNTLQLLTAKPVIYLLNMSEEDFARQKNKFLVKIKEWITARSKDPIIPYSAALELTLFKMSPEDQIKYCNDNKVRSMLPKIITTGYNMLHLITFFTCGADEVKAWTVHRGAKAPQAAGTIHSDFEKFFIQAEIQAYADFKELGSEAAVRNAGKLKTAGKEHVVQDGDIIFFKHAAGGASKKK